MFVLLLVRITKEIKIKKKASEKHFIKESVKLEVLLLEILIFFRWL